MDILAGRIMQCLVLQSDPDNKIYCAVITSHIRIWAFLTTGKFSHLYLGSSLKMENVNLVADILAAFNSITLVSLLAPLGLHLGKYVDVHK